jgi:hypothetical protein
VGVRRLLALVNGLPPEAALWREEMAWTAQDELAARSIEVIDGWGRAHAQLMGARRRELADPIHVPRPGERPAAAREIETDPRRIAAWFRQMSR